MSFSASDRGERIPSAELAPKPPPGLKILDPKKGQTRNAELEVQALPAPTLGQEPSSSRVEGGGWGRGGPENFEPGGLRKFCSGQKTEQVAAIQARKHAPGNFPKKGCPANVAEIEGVNAGSPR